MEKEKLFIQMVREILPEGDTDSVDALLRLIASNCLKVYKGGC